jgi:hypothetical protein
MDLTTYEFQSSLFRSRIENARAEGAAEGEARSEARGAARALLILLAARSVYASKDQRARIVACTDVALLERWVARTATAATTEEVLADR